MLTHIMGGNMAALARFEHSTPRCRHSHHPSTLCDVFECVSDRWLTCRVLCRDVLPTSCATHRGNPHLQPVLGVAWDFGAVTTG